MEGRKLPGIGHNNGPAMDRGVTYRAYQWKRARQKLMPKTIPLFVVKMRVRRAAELGMSYAAYAKCRQATGHDILALLFSSNALRVIGPGAEMPDAETRALAQVRAAKKLTLVHRPAQPGAVLQANPVLDAAGAAPKFTESWSAMRERVQGFIRAQGMPARQVLIIGDAPLEEEWSTAAQACGYLRSSEYFAHQ
ncbi:hypothetical protein [Marinibacterium profundimaris]|uniref:Uncharacterized protein n=1 Tax=Marinibacterium profundimaris TaxID=1679460 RepID=A0A225NTZ0_9RHOB|nr:hypothetical protein [Marinibacterium profundimaris]OWU75050.1 hypothetical protein ATO3_10990 [Marinibacterium profundimaris]